MFLFVFFVSLSKRRRSFFFFYIDRVYAIRALLIFIRIIRALIFSMFRLFANKTIKFFIIDFILWLLERFRIVMKIIELIIIARCRAVVMTFKFIIRFIFFEFKIVFEIFIILVLMISVSRVIIALITFHCFFLHYC